jgi:hypothetical protein
MFDFILENLPEDIKLRAEKKLEPLAACQHFFAQFLFYQKFWQFFLQKICFLNLHQE